MILIALGLSINSYRRPLPATFATAEAPVAYKLAILTFHCLVGSFQSSDRFAEELTATLAIVNRGVIFKFRGQHKTSR